MAGSPDRCGVGRSKTSSTAGSGPVECAQSILTAISRPPDTPTAVAAPGHRCRPRCINERGPSSRASICRTGSGTDRLRMPSSPKSLADQIDPNRRTGIGVVGAGFIVRDCHLVAYADAGFRVVGITSRTLETAREVAALRGVPKVYRIARGDARRPGDRGRRRRRAARRAAGRDPPDPRRIPAGCGASWRRSRWRCRTREAAALVEACERAGVLLQVNQNMRYDQSVRALKTLLDEGRLGDPVLATIEMRAIPHWMPWAAGGRSLSTFIMSIHHLDTFRYWLGDPIAGAGEHPARPADRVPPRRRDQPVHPRISRTVPGPRPGTTSGRARRARGRGRAPRSAGGSRGPRAWRSARSAGPAGPSGSPARSTTRRSATEGDWHRPRWPEAWFPDAFAGTMGGLLRALETGTEPDISGRDNLKTIALCEAVLAAGAARESRGRTNSPGRHQLDTHSLCLDWPDFPSPQSAWPTDGTGPFVVGRCALLLGIVALAAVRTRRWRRRRLGRFSQLRAAGRPSAAGPNASCARPRSSITRWSRPSRR